MDTKITSKSDLMRGHLDQCKLSGKTVIDYCKEHNLSEATYYYWHTKFRSPSPGSFIQLPTLKSDGVLEVCFPNGVKIHFNQLVPTAYLKELGCCI